MPPKSSTKSTPAPATTPKKSVSKAKKPNARTIDIVEDETRNNTKPPSKKIKSKDDKTTDEHPKVDKPTIPNDSTKKPQKKKSKAPKKKKNTKENVDESDSDEPTQIRFPNYKEDEDVEICCSWLETTEDPLNSTNQTSDTFWERVREHYLSKVPIYKRPLKSIKTRWQTIQRAVNKFNGCYKQIQRANQSGTTGQDQINGALKLYAALEKRSFNHLRCFNILSPSPKWNEYCSTLDEKNNKTTTTESDLPPSSAMYDLSSEINPSDAASDVTQVASQSKALVLARPTGNKKAKEARIQEIKDAKWKEDMVKVHRDLASQSQAQNAILAEQKDAMVTMAEESIMRTDLTTLPPAQRVFFEWKQEKILDKIKRERDMEAKKREEEERKKEQERKEAEEAKNDSTRIQKTRAKKTTVQKRKQAAVEVEEVEDDDEDEDQGNEESSDESDDENNTEEDINEDEEGGAEEEDSD